MLTSQGLCSVVLFLSIKYLAQITEPHFVVLPSNILKGSYNTLAACQLPFMFLNLIFKHFSLMKGVKIAAKERVHTLSYLVWSFPETESLYWLCHQRQAADEIHAREQAVFPVQDVEIRGVTSIRIRHHDFNRPQHSCADDEGQSFILLTWPGTQIQKSSLLAQGDFFSSQYDTVDFLNI